jgi:tartrate dehydrogenase/decarboxylase/D-malate dehydrogenase
MFEPIHGSAPDIAGKAIANPIASIWSVSQMLDFFGQEEWGKIVLTAIEQVLVKNECLTPDLGGKAKTNEVGDAVVSVICAMKKN